MQTRRIAVANGVELAVDRWPARAPAPDQGGATAPLSFILVHGLASNARLWDGVATALNDLGDEALTVDLRGHGRSSKPDEGYDVPTVADDLAALLTGLGLDGPIVAGQSWGGNVVLELAARHPDLLRAAALVDGGWLELAEAFPDLETCLVALAPPRLVGLPLAEVEARIRAAHPDWPETGIRGTLGNFEVRPDGTIAPWLTYARHLTVLRGLWQHHPAVRYAGIPVPVLLIPADGPGREAADRKRAAVAAAAAALPRARVQWMRGDHDLHAQHPATVAAALHELGRHGVPAVMGTP